MSNSTADTPLAVYNDKTWLQGALLTGVAYGVVLTLFPMCFHLLLKQMKPDNRRQTLGFLIYISAMFITGTLSIASCFEMAQLSFIQHRNFPGGPQAFETEMFDIPVDDIGNVSLIVSLWLADGLMVWRCYIIYQSFLVPIWLVMAIPCLLWIATFISGIFLACQESNPFASLWVSSTVNMTLPVMALSLTLNTLVTLMIAARLMWFRYHAKKHLGPEHGKMYTSIAAMIVESSFLYFATFFTMMVTFIMNNPLQNIFLQLVSEVQIIAPLLITYRVAEGKAWSSTTAARVSGAATSVLFSTNPGGITTGSVGLTAISGEGTRFSQEEKLPSDTSFWSSVA